MKNEIQSNLANPRQLEKLYRKNKPAFKHAFNELYPQLQDNELASFWNARLNFDQDEISRGTRSDLTVVIIASLLAGVIIKLPAFLPVDEDFFYTRNIGFSIFPMLSAYFAWKNRLSVRKIGFIAGAFLACLIFINVLPVIPESDSILLSCLHLPLLLWSILGFVFVGGRMNNGEKRLSYLSYNGDLVVMTTLILIAGAILTGVTIGLFALIGLDIEKIYFDYVVISGLPMAPILATYLTQTNPQLVGKVSPMIAKLFSPLVFVMLVTYLGAIIYSGKNPYNDREFLLVFNLLLIGVMAIIFFSVATVTDTATNRREIWTLTLLSTVTVIVNSIALSAILFRISEWGITPNRAAVLGSNLLILINLLMVTVQLFRTISMHGDISAVGKSISRYLPIYCLWVIIVTFLFPLIFWFN